MHALEWSAAVAAVLLVSWRWRPLHAIAPGIGILVACYALLGAWALWFGVFAAAGEEPSAFLSWKPTVLYWTLALTLFASPALGWGYPAKAVIGTYFAFSNREWRWINFVLATLCVVLGGANLYIAYHYPAEDWDGFKWSCMVNVIAVSLLRFTFVWVDTIAGIVVHVYRRVKVLFP